MATPHEKLAASLTVLRRLQKRGQRVFQSDDVGRVHRERLLQSGFVQEVIKGWLISSSPSASNPSARDGDTTPWYASFWEFCARYCDERFGDKWHLSPEQSLFLHAEKTVIPSQVIVHTPAGTNHKLTLRFGTSLFDLKQLKLPSPSEITVRDGLRLFTPEASLIGVPESFIARNPVETQLVLASIRDTADLLRLLLDGGHSFVAGRLAGALRRTGRSEEADDILKNMKAAGYSVREADPFAGQKALTQLSPSTPPIVGRMQTMWADMRDQILEIFPAPPGLPASRKAFLKSVDEVYRHDAYHSLSIEGYRVSPELINRVRKGNWDPEHLEADRQDRDALAARGYFQAFQSVTANISRILAGESPGRIVRTAHRDWYREMFQPCVTAGLIAPSALAGYRNDAVYLRGSAYVPPRWETVRDAVPALFALLENEPEPAVRAVLGHWLFGYIHPYPDGNGRIARFLMNTMLASGGYPWTVVRVEDRDAYLAALDRASIGMDIVPFARLMASAVLASKKTQATKR